MSDLDGIDWRTVEITIVPDPLWTPEMEAAAQEWLALIEHLNGGELPYAGDGSAGAEHTEG